jgi:hypothetical protein
MGSKNIYLALLPATVFSILLAGCAGGDPGGSGGNIPPGNADLAIEDILPGEPAPDTNDLFDTIPPIPDTSIDLPSTCTPTCDDGLACTDDICANGSCTHPVKTGFCLVNGKCIADGATSTTGCGRCNANSSPNSWVDDVTLCEDDGISCTKTTCTAASCGTTLGAGFCLVDNACIADGEAAADNGCQICNVATSTTSLQAQADASPCPDDGANCTEDFCEAGSCVHPIKASSCLVDGVCYTNSEVNPSDDCQYCDPSTANDVWATRPSGSACATDGFDCTDDICSAGSCTHEVKSSSCLIAGTCYDTGDVNPLAECESCQPTQAKDDWGDSAYGTPCTDDALSCTEDVCFSGKCYHNIDSGSCLISGTCFNNGEANPSQPCQVCNPTSVTALWSDLAEGAACLDDGLSCTDDVCTAGVCEHPVLADRCLVGGTCYNTNATVSTADCTACAPSIDPLNGTNADGLSCSDSDSATKLDFCLAGTCRGYAGTNWSWVTSDTSTAANAVTHIDGSGFWVAGTLTNSGGTISGFIGRTNGTSGLTSTKYALDEPYLDISHRLAVGEEGLASYYTGSGWTAAADVSTLFGTDPIASVWGATLAGSSETFFVGSNAGNVAHCTTSDNGSTFACSSPTGISAAANIGSLSGTLTGAGAQGPLWAFRSNTYEDIYAYDPTATTFSTADPTGCYDGSNKPCANTSGRFLDSWALNASDVWGVGEKGLVMRYDGQAWAKVEIPSISTTQDDYNFRGITGIGDLLILVGERAHASTYHDLVILKYNRLLNHWHNPQILLYTTLVNANVASYRLNDIAAALNTNDLCLVGSTWDSTDTERQAFYYYLP